MKLHWLFKGYEYLFKWKYELADMGLPGLAIRRNEAKLYCEKHLIKDLKKAGFDISVKEIIDYIQNFIRMRNALITKNDEEVKLFYPMLKFVSVGSIQKEFIDFKVGAYYSYLIERGLENTDTAMKYLEIWNQKKKII